MALSNIPIWQSIETMKPRGGKRINAGRKRRTIPKITITVEISKEDKDLLKKNFPGYGSLSNAFRAFINQFIK